jgi:diguanylate cyclase (GGDEF)-like protein
MNENNAEAARLYNLQLEALFLRTRTSSVLALLPIVLIAGLHYSHVPSGQIFMWAVALLGVYTLRILIAHTFLERARRGNASPLWLDIETMTTAAAGGGWGAMLFFLNTGQLDMLFTVKLAFLSAAAAFTMNSMAAVRFVYLAFLLPVFTIVVAYALMETPFLTAPQRYGLMASAALFFVLLLIMSASICRLMNEALVQRLAFSDLAARLETTLDAERQGREQLEQQARQMEATHLRLHVFATHDPLTRVFNRHRISEALVRELHLQRRYQIPVSALVVEIDGFAEISEGHGQARGDELLIAFAGFLAADLREIDYVGRWGGEKFCCVLPRTDGREGLECAERLRHRIAARSFIESAPELRITASFGVSPAVQGDDPERLLARADAALYSARREGRNCSRQLANDEPPEQSGTTTA